MDAGKLKHRVTLQVKTPSSIWDDYVTVWAAIRPLSAKESIDRGDVQQNATHQVTIRMRRDVNSTMRVLFAGRIYDIQSILPHYQDRDRLELTCEELHEMNDTIAVIRSQKIIGPYNVVTTEPLPPREVACCIVDVQHSHNQAGNDPVNWEKKAVIDCNLDEDIVEGDTIAINVMGDFFVAEVKPTKHFLSVVALQTKRGAE